MGIFQGITVITAVKDNPSGLKALEESLERLGCELEWVVVDDNGESLKHINGSLNLIGITQKSTIYEAFNIGTEHATSSHVIFIGSDDLCLPGLANLQEVLQGCDVDVICAQPSGPYNGEGFKLDHLLQHNYCQQGLIYSREIVRKIGFETRYRIASDYLLNVRIALNPDLLVKNYPVDIVHFSDGGISSTTWDTLFHVEWDKHARSHSEIRLNPFYHHCVRKICTARQIRLRNNAFDWPSIRTMFRHPPKKKDLAAFAKGIMRMLNPG